MSAALFVLNEPTILRPHEREPFDGHWSYRGRRSGGA